MRTLALLATLLATLALWAAVAAAGECCAYKGRDAACIPCRPTQGV